MTPLHSSNRIHWLFAFLAGLLCVELAGLLEGLGLLRTRSPRLPVEWLHAVALYAWLGLALGTLAGAVALLAPATWRRRGIVFACMLGSTLFVGGPWLNLAPWFPSFGSAAGKLWSAGFVLLATVGAALVAAAAVRLEGLTLRASRAVLVCCLALLVLPPLWFLRPEAQLERQPANPEATPVFVILVDTLRRDHLSCYGYERETSPHLDALARDGIRFTAATTTSNFTLPSVATLFSGLYPSRHRMTHWNHELTGEATLTEQFARAGYRCGAFVGNPTLKPERGFGRGFDHFFPRALPRWGLYEKTAPEILFHRLANGPDVERSGALIGRALRWLERDSDRSPFLYMHLMDPHSPYAPPMAELQRFLPEGASPGPKQPPRIFRYDTGDFDATHWHTWDEVTDKPTIDDEALRGMLARYDGEIHFVDFWIGEFLKRLKELDLYERALIVVLADHGEEFGEHGGWFHGHTLHAEMVDMPLILKLPGNAQAGRVTPLTLDMVDLAPTLAALVGIDGAPRWEGEDLSALEDSLRSVTYLERPPYLTGFQDERWKLIRKAVGGVPEWKLYDRVRDPREQRNLAGDDSLRTADLAARLLELMRAHGALDWQEGDAASDPALQAELRALGYVE